MRQVVMHTAGDVRVEEREDPKIIEPTDAIVRLTATCICGSDLWVLPRRRASRPPGDGARVRRRGRGDRLGGEEPQGRRLRRRLVRHLGQHLEICQSGCQSMCVHSAFVAQTIGTQSEKAQIPFADGTLVPTPGQPDPGLITSLLAASDVLGTGWFGAVAAEAGPGKTVAVVGDGAVGLMAILAAKQLGAERIAMSRHPERQELARFYGATDIVEERGDEGVAKVKELTGGLGAHSVVEAVGTQEAFEQAVNATRPAATWALSASTTTSRSLASTRLGEPPIRAGCHGSPPAVTRWIRRYPLDSAADLSSADGTQSTSWT